MTEKMKYNKKRLLITGGTGSFGNAVLQRFHKTDISEIRNLSRDEKKQDDQRQKYASNKLKFYLGDVRDPQSVQAAVRNEDFIFYAAAALKQVPYCCQLSYKKLEYRTARFNEPQDHLGCLLRDGCADLSVTFRILWPTANGGATSGYANPCFRT